MAGLQNSSCVLGAVFPLRHVGVTCTASLRKGQYRYQCRLAEVRCLLVQKIFQLLSSLIVKVILAISMRASAQQESLHRKALNLHSMGLGLHCKAGP